MRSMLSRNHREVLEQFAWSNVLLAFDFDGTLAPIVSDPDRAAMRATTCQRLATLAGLYPVCVISGRARADVLGRLKGSGVHEVVGNHGIESLQVSGKLAAEVRSWVPRLQSRLGALRGVVIEDKGFSLAIHYRQSREKKRARAAILAAAALLGDVRIIGGKQVVNMLPRGAPHKGLALEATRERLGCDTAVYVGDDDTDEDVFAMEQPGRLLAIRVGDKRTSQAAYYLRRQVEIDELLRLLGELRSGVRKHNRAQS